jgi:drug/metabolite transporter (DMT)-like permease
MLMFFADQLDSGRLLGNILAVGSGVCFAGMTVSNKRRDADPSQSLMLGFMINAAVGLPFAFFEATADPVAWASIIFLGVVQVGIAYVFFSIGISRTPALLACLITAIEPVLNPILVALFMREAPGLNAIAGGAVIIVTVVGYNVWLERRPSPAKQR